MFRYGSRSSTSERRRLDHFSFATSVDFMHLEDLDRLWGPEEMVKQASARQKRNGHGGAGAALDDDLLAPVAFALPEIAPGEGMWQRIEAAIGTPDDLRESRRQIGKAIRRDEGWRRYSRDVQIKRLWDRDTFLLRCDPGGVLPAHQHRKFEHCIVLEGDMIVGSETYRAGDYHGMPPGVPHADITSLTGLLMLVRYQEA